MQMKVWEIWGYDEEDNDVDDTKIMDSTYSYANNKQS